jgi:hypothetical protein
MMTETTTATTSIPTNYAITARPASLRSGTPLNPRLVSDLEATLRSGQSLSFSTEGLDARDVGRIAARLNAVGRRAGRDFAVRTRRTDNQLFAWAVQRLPTSRKRKGSGEAIPPAE